MNKNVLSFVEMVYFLEEKDYYKEIKPFIKNYGIELEKSEEHPVIKDLIEEFDISKDIVSLDKIRLNQLDINMKVVASFDSVRDANEKTGISSSTISNVLCEGKSALKYTKAGGFFWTWSNKMNIKYI